MQLPKGSKLFQGEGYTLGTQAQAILIFNHQISRSNDL